MSKTRTKYSTSVVYKKIEKEGKELKKVVYYLSNRDEENGMDIQFDMAGYTVESL